MASARNESLIMNFEERESLRSRRVSFTVSVPITLAEILDVFAEARGMTTSTALAHLIRQGLRREADLASKQA